MSVRALNQSGRGDAAAGAFATFFRANYAKTVRLAHLLTGSNTFAEDLAQDAFARVRSQP